MTAGHEAAYADGHLFVCGGGGGGDGDGEGGERGHECLSIQPATGNLVQLGNNQLDFFAFFANWFWAEIFWLFKNLCTLLMLAWRQN